MVEQCEWVVCEDIKLRTYACVKKWPRSGSVGVGVPDRLVELANKERERVCVCFQIYIKINWQ